MLRKSNYCKFINICTILEKMCMWYKQLTLQSEMITPLFTLNWELPASHLPVSHAANAALLILQSSDHTVSLSHFETLYFNGIEVRYFMYTTVDTALA